MLRMINLEHSVRTNIIFWDCVLNICLPQIILVMYCRCGAPWFAEIRNSVGVNYWYRLEKGVHGEFIWRNTSVLRIICQLAISRWVHISCTHYSISVIAASRTQPELAVTVASLVDHVLPHDSFIDVISCTAFFQIWFWGITVLFFLRLFHGTTFIWTLGSSLSLTTRTAD